jgi:uncharacterized protein GlcG (DUF336 family)
MRLKPKLSALAALGIGALLSPGLHAQQPGVVAQRNLSIELALTIAQGALAECRAKGHHNSVVVLDRASQVLVVLRDERANAGTVEMARRKAYTAQLFRMSSLEFQKRIASDPRFGAQRDVADVLALPGGVPIQAGNEVIGGVASSGSNPEDDDGCAKAGIAKVAEQLR